MSGNDDYFSYRHASVDRLASQPYIPTDRNSEKHTNNNNNNGNNNNTSITPRDRPVLSHSVSALNVQQHLAAMDEFGYTSALSPGTPMTFAALRGHANVPSNVTGPGLYSFSQSQLSIPRVFGEKDNSMLVRRDSDKVSLPSVSSSGHLTITTTAAHNIDKYSNDNNNSNVNTGGKLPNSPSFILPGKMPLKRSSSQRTSPGKNTHILDGARRNLRPMSSNTGSTSSTNSSTVTTPTYVLPPDIASIAVRGTNSGNNFAQQIQQSQPRERNQSANNTTTTTTINLGNNGSYSPPPLTSVMQPFGSPSLDTFVSSSPIRPILLSPNSGSSNSNMGTMTTLTNANANAGTNTPYILSNNGSAISTATTVTTQGNSVTTMALGVAGASTPAAAATLSSTAIPSASTTNMTTATATTSTTTATATTTASTPGSTGASSSIAPSTNSLNSRSFKKQYILNEKLYLEKMKKSIRSDEYYTHGINSPTSVVEEEAYEDFETDVDDMSNIDAPNAEFPDIVAVNNGALNGNLGAPSVATIPNNNTGNRLVSTGENLLAMNPKYLLKRLRWLSDTEPENKAAVELLESINRINNGFGNGTEDMPAFTETEEKIPQQSNPLLDSRMDGTVGDKVHDVNGPIDTLGNDFSQLDLERDYLIELSRIPTIAERFRWQKMLTNVLRGDIVRSEKTKIAKQIKNPAIKNQYSDDIWFELKAWMSGKTKDEVTRSIKFLRESSDSLIDEILNFRIEDSIKSDYDQIEIKLRDITGRYYKFISLWPNNKKLHEEKPITKTENFRSRIAVFHGWLNIKENYSVKVQHLLKWIGNNKLERDPNSDEWISQEVDQPRTFDNDSHTRNQDRDDQNDEESDQQQGRVNSDEDHIALTTNAPIYASFSTAVNDVSPDTKLFAEQIMKERDIEAIFQKKVFRPLAPWIAKTKTFLLKYNNILNELNLEIDKKCLEYLLLFPIKLVNQIILIRLTYARRLKNPTMMMVDQMIDDFSSYIRLSVQLKYTIGLYCNDLPFQIVIDPEFDKTVLEAISYLFILLHLKIIDSSKRTLKMFKEPELLLKYWEELKNVGPYIENAGKLIANEFNKLSLRMIRRLHVYLLQQQDLPPTFKTNTEAEKWLVEIFEHLGAMKRKLNRFTDVLTKAVQNAVKYRIMDHKGLLRSLKDTGHFLIYTGGQFEANGLYLIGSPELMGCSDEVILKILCNRDLGSSLLPTIELKNSLALYNLVGETAAAAVNPHKIFQPNRFTSSGSNSLLDPGSTSVSVHNAGRMPTLPDTPGFYPVSSGTEQYMKEQLNKNVSFVDIFDSDKEILRLEMKLQSLGYLIILCPGEPVLWESDIHNLSSIEPLSLDEFELKLAPNTLCLINQGSTHVLEYQNDKLQQIIGNTALFTEKCCSYLPVENNLQAINRAYFRFTYSILSNYSKLVNTFRETCPNNELLNSIFLFVRDFGSNFLKTNVANCERRSVIILLMIKLSIGWLSFIVDDCDPTDQKTFRWCVLAMEFAMHMTTNYNVLALNESQFNDLKQKISACMSLLISHFDVMGARAIENEKTSQQVRMNIGVEEDLDDDDMLALNSELRLKAIKELEQRTKKNPRQIGKVLDDTDNDDKYLLSLATSLSNVSIRWQKRNYVGGGTFGTVYSAVNLDNGEVLAVKEIKMYDSKTMRKIFPTIKEEMTVLEMLNHPNIVQYYGVEVHRDRVNIFMEYCDGGSLASLLEHGRIEDEMVTQIYTLELLEGLAYLHQSGVVHRDIKPDNILLDHNGVIKYVDFGAAKKIARNGTRILNTHSKAGGGIESRNDLLRNRSNKEDRKEESSAALQNLVGTPMYMAPEIITGSKHKGRFGADDIWSLGCVVLEMITGRRPWSFLDNEWAIMYHVAAGRTPQLPTPEEVSNKGRRFLRRCLVQNPEKRASAVELLMDPWIVEIRELAFGPADDVQSPSNTVTGETDGSATATVNG